MISLVSRLFAFGLIVSIAAGAVMNPNVVRAQDGDVSIAQASPETAQTPTGTLRLQAVTCEIAEGASSAALLLAEEFSPDASCYDGTAPVLVDGLDYGPAAPVLELELDAGTHTVTDVNSGLNRAVEIYADSLTTVWVVNYLVVELAETTTEEEPVVEVVGLSLVMHVCEPGVQSADDLLALGSRFARLSMCPVITLPGENAPAGTVNAGQDWFDFAIQDASGFSASVVDAVFVSDAVCESGIGVELNTNPFDDACFSTSSYAFEVPVSSLGITATSIPALHRIAYAEAGEASYDPAVSLVDPASGYFELDAGSGWADPLVVHVYLAAPPQVTIVQHLCGADIASAESLDALGGFVPRVLACPAVDLGVFGFDVTVADGAAVSHSLSAVAPETWSVCELDLGFDFNGDASDNACLEMPSYRVTGVTRGLVELWQTFASEAHLLGGMDFVPGTNDSATFLSLDPAQAMVSLDTSNDGDVVVHLYAVASAGEPDPEPIPTPTPVPPTEEEESGTGSVQIAALYCLGSRNQTTLTALAPGQQATAAAIGGDCFGGDAQVQITLADGSAQPAFRIGRDGLEWIDGLPVAGASSGFHMLIDQVSNKSAPFEVQAGVVTRIILRVEVALGNSASDDTSTGPGNSETIEDGPQSTNPLDLLNNLVTDQLITDELGGSIPDAGTSLKGSFDSNAFVVDLLSGLQTDELGAVTAEGMPVVGAWESPGGKAPAIAMLLGSTIVAGLAGWLMRRPGARRQHGL